MLWNNFYQIFGQMVVLAGAALLVLLLVTLILGRILIKQDKLIFPRVLIFTLDLLYGPFKKFSVIMGLDEKIVDQIGVEVRNKVNQKKFENIEPREKLLILPHCLRSLDCKAKLESSGLICNDCKKCVIGVLKEKGEKLGYKVFIIPGSTFLQKIAEKNKFKAVLGVACYQDLNLAMMKMASFSPQGVVLSRDGCIKTKVDIKAVLDKMGYPSPINTPEESLTPLSSCSKDHHRGPYKEF